METSKSSPTNAYWLCPLYSFDCDCESVDLAEGIQIKQIPREFADYLLKQSHSSFFRTYPSEAEWMASLPYLAVATSSNVKENMRVGLEESYRARDLLVDLVIALKLCHEGRVVAGPLVFASIHNSGWSIGSSTIWTSVSEINFFQEEPKYVLHQSDTPQVNDLVKTLSKLREVEKLSSMDTALRRLHSSYHGAIEDRIIDQMIAFESLYIGEERGIKQKLALRTASLVGENQEMREEIFNSMKDAYQKRCNIVHVIEQVTREELQKINPITENYLRQSIRRFLALLLVGYSLDDIKRKIKELAKLDENILSNGTLLASDKPSKE